eukprot:746122-Hanusia_phi.AAC.5
MDRDKEDENDAWNGKHVKERPTCGRRRDSQREWDSIEAEERSTGASMRILGAGRDGAGDI